MVQRCAVYVRPQARVEAQPPDAALSAETEAVSEFNNLKLDVENEIAVLTISRPAALNALNSETLDELNTALTEIEGRDDIKVVILTGGPDKKDNAFKSFVAGADIAEMVNFTAPEARAFGIRASVPFFKLMNMRQVTIAAVNGFALGGGCDPITMLVFPISTARIIIFLTLIY